MSTSSPLPWELAGAARHACSPTRVTRRPAPWQETVTCEPWGTTDQGSGRAHLTSRPSQDVEPPLPSSAVRTTTSAPRAGPSGFHALDTALPGVNPSDDPSAREWRGVDPPCPSSGPPLLPVPPLPPLPVPLLPVPPLPLPPLPPLPPPCILEAVEPSAKTSADPGSATRCNDASCGDDPGAAAVSFAKQLAGQLQASGAPTLPRRRTDPRAASTSSKTAHTPAADSCVAPARVVGDSTPPQDGPADPAEQAARHRLGALLELRDDESHETATIPPAEPCRFPAELQSAGRAALLQIQTACGAESDRGGSNDPSQVAPSRAGSDKSQPSAGAAAAMTGGSARQEAAWSARAGLAISATAVLAVALTAATGSLGGNFLRRRPLREGPSNTKLTWSPPPPRTVSPAPWPD